MRLSCLLSLVFPCSLAFSAFSCPPRCQCYEDVEEKSNSMHLICKWEQLNTTNLDSLGRADLVRTLTVRCPHYARTPSHPPAGIFHGLRNLDRLEIDRCILHSLPGALFAGLHQLYSLILKNARLPDIPKELFSHTPNLMTLDMTGNDLRIEPYALRSLSNLIHLDLSNNSINFLANTLVSLTKLKVLTMDNNRLSNIDFRRLPEELSDLSLRHNSINTIHYVPNSARYLRRIDLSGNQLDFLSSSGSVNVLPPGLKTADLSHNKIAYVQDGTVAHLNKLTVLDLKNNSLTDLRESSVSGSKVKLRLFVADNPFQCHCNLQWMVHPLTKICPESCTCCEDVSCDCRTSCPQGCQCYRSANIASNRTAQNAVQCDSVRLDRLVLPSSLTELRLSSADWRDWSPDPLLLPRIRSIAITNSKMTEEQANSLALIPSLVEADLSYNQISAFPAKLSRLSRLRLEQNPLQEPTLKDIAVMDAIKKIRIAGNISSFSCDCESPSALQRWLREAKNREKIEDLDCVECELSSFGKVPIVSTLPGNGSLCPDETVDTSQWIKFVQNTQKKIKPTMEMRSEDDPEGTTSYSVEIQKDRMLEGIEQENERIKEELERKIEKLKEEKEKLKEKVEEEETTSTTTTEGTTTRKTTKTMSTTTAKPAFTTPRHRKKYHKDEPDEYLFVNALTVVLVICVVVLTIAIGTTLYYRFEQAEEEAADSKSTPEEAPLHEE